MVTLTKLLTADEYLKGDEQLFTELIDGEVVVNSPIVRHQRIAAHIYRRIDRWCEAEPGRGETAFPIDYRLNDFNVFAPDVWWLSEARRPGREDTHVVGPPDLAVEVRSDSTWRYDVGTKLRTYEDAGLAELWLLDTKADTVLVYRRSSPAAARFDIALELRGGEALTTPLLPGLTIDISELFDR